MTKKKRKVLPLDVISNDEKEIEILKQEELQEEQFWKGYSNKIKEQVKTENIFEEVQKFHTDKEKEKNNFFKRFLKILGF
jgi:hypothetical protein